MPQFSPTTYEVNKAFEMLRAYNVPRWHVETMLKNSVGARLESNKDPVGDFHRARGCCDGTEPSDCYRRMEEDRNAAIERQREAARLAKLRDADEYSGTAPSGEVE